MVAKMPGSSKPLITVAVPSFNQAEFLQECLDSLYQQGIALEICVADGGSVDGSKSVLEKNSAKLHWYQSKPDGGQSAAINLAVSKSSAPYIYWLNSDDVVLPDALSRMLNFLEKNPKSPMVYGKAIYIDEHSNKVGVCYTQEFSRFKNALRCIVCQPATLIRRSAWEEVGGLDESMNMAMDYDLWWRITRHFGDLDYLDSYVAAARLHGETKTNMFRREHYVEALGVVKQYYKIASVFWYLKWPWSVWYKSIQLMFEYRNPK